MRRYPHIIIFTIFAFISEATISQVGINTTDPKATLDVNGNVKISKTNPINVANSNLDSIALYGTNGELKRVNLNDFFNKRLSKLVRVFATKGDGQSIPDNNPTKVTGWSTTQIDNATQGTGMDWNPTTGDFTVSKAGWYRVSAALTYAKGNIVAGNEYNVQVRKNGVQPPVGSLPHFTESTTTGSIAINTGELSVIVNCVVGDKLSIYTYQNQGSARPLIVTGNPSLCSFIIEQM